MNRGLICFVGKDIEYAAKAIEIVSAEGISIGTIAGETAEQVRRAINIDLKAKFICTRRPWQSTDFAESIKEGQVLGLNCGFDYIIPTNVLSRIKILNAHPSYLPYNRGCHHSFWGIMESTPLGATLHWMDAGIDTGPILAQKLLKPRENATAREIQQQSNQLCLELLRENLQHIMTDLPEGTPQKAGSYHSRKAILAASTIFEGQTITSKDLFKLCRAVCNKNNGFRIKINSTTFLIRISDIEKLEP